MESFKKIKNSEMVLARFGFWPEFGDDELLEIHLEQHEGINTLTFIIAAIQYGKEKNCKVKFECQKIKNLNLEGFNHQNVISKVDFKIIDNEIEVLIEPSYGLFAQFTCTSILVSLIF